MSQVHFHQFDAEYASAYHTLEAVKKLDPKGFGYVCQFACGSGVWLAAAQALEANRLLGIDRVAAADEPHCIPSSFIANYDLSQVRVSLPETANLAINILYLQQLPEERAPAFVEDLCKSSNRVLFGALTPFQLSSQSCNLKWPSYWARLFANLGFYPELRFRPMVWSNRFIDPSIRQNVLLYVKRAKNYKFTQPFENLDVVHPSLFETYMTRQNWFAQQLTKSTIGKIVGITKP
jgi:hypothetical protein